MITCTNAHFCTVGVARPRGIEDANFQPVSPVRSDILKQPGSASGRGHQQTGGTVSFEIGGRQAAANIPSATERRVGQRYVAELAGAVARKELIAFGVRLPETKVSALRFA